MLVIAAIAAIATLLWLAVWLRFQGLFGGVLLVLMTGTVFGHPFFHRNIGPIPVTIDRALLVIVCMAAVLFYRFGRFQWPRTNRANAAAVALLLVLLASTLTHDWKTRHFHPLATWLFFYTLPILAFLLVQTCPMQRRHAWALVTGLALLAAYLGVTGIFETREWYSLVWPRFIVDPTYSEFFGRARGPLLNPIGNGILLTAGLVSAIVVMMRLRGPAIIVPAAITLLCAAGIYLTRTRSVWLGSAAAVWLIFAIKAPRRIWIAATLVMLLAGSVIAVTQWEHLNAFKRDRDVSVAEMSESASLRPILATIAWKIFQDHPLAGVGFGQYIEQAQRYCSDRDTNLPLDKGRPFVQHNVYLSILSETGLIGLAVYLYFLGSCAAAAVQVLRSPSSRAWHRDIAALSLATLAAYSINGMFHEVSIIPMTNFAVFALLGITQAVHAAVFPIANRSPRRTVSVDRGAIPVSPSVPIGVTYHGN